MNNSLFGSYWKDLFLHIGPGMIFFFLIGHYYSFSGLTFGFLIITSFVYAIDSGHFFITAWRSYLKPDYGPNRFVLFSSPIIIGILLFINFYYFSRYCHWPIIIYSVVHGYKQLHGVLRLYQAKQGVFENYTAQCLRIAMSANMVMGLFDPLMAGFPDYRPPPSFFIHYAAIVVLFSALSYGVYREWKQPKEKQNWYKILFFVATPFMFFFCVKFAVHYVQLELALLLAHAIQYYGIIYLAQKASDEKSDILKFVFYGAISLAVAFAFFEFVPRQFDFYDMVFKNRFYTWQEMHLNWKLSLANAIAHIPIFVHFWLDGFVWSKQRNPELSNLYLPANQRVNDV